MLYPTPSVITFLSDKMYTLIFSFLNVFFKPKNHTKFKYNIFYLSNTLIKFDELWNYMMFKHKISLYNACITTCCVFSIKMQIYLIKMCKFPNIKRT